MKKYDVFISYRRSSFESANLIATRLKAAGYRVFFDLESMRSGPFNEQLYNVIEHCRDFVLVLPPNALDRCVNEEDWVRKEICHAMAHKKNIIPVMLNGFEWPKQMPQGLEGLENYQSITSSVEFFDLVMKRLESYLKSRKYTLPRVIARWCSIVLLGLLVLFAPIFLLFRVLSVPVCEKVVEHLTIKVMAINFMLEDNKLIAEEWKEYRPYLDGANAEAKDDVYATIQAVENSINEYEQMSNMTIDFSAWEEFLLSFYKMRAESVTSFDALADGQYRDMRSTMNFIRHHLAEEFISPSSHDFGVAAIDTFNISAEKLYFIYLQMINEFPKSALGGYYEVAPMLTALPQIGLGQSRVEYDVLINRSDESMALLSNMSEANRDIVDELFMEEYNVKAQGAEALEQYKQRIKAFNLNKEASKGENWLKIVCVANIYKDAIVDDQEALATFGRLLDINAQLVLSDLHRLLDDFKSLYPYATYVPAVKHFFAQNINNPEFGGVLISEFASGKKHNVYKVGDIITEWNGVRVNNLKTLRGAYAQSQSGNLKLLRLENGKLKELALTIPGNEDIVAFTPLVNE